ncbi:MAG: class II fumarate hydratase [Gemmataceae bacterium]
MHMEQDALGEVGVPDDVYYGAQTQRAKENFPISGRGIPEGLIRALGLLKGAAARANRELGLLPAHLADAMVQAAAEVAEGKLSAHFVVDVFQTGSGTSSHMNANEVIAKRTNELLTGQRQSKTPAHPNDHVNLGQSSNDVFPTAIHLAALRALNDDLLPALAQLRDELTVKARAFDGIVKIGRTHGQDATPVRLGQEFAGYARMIERGRQRLVESRPLLEEVPLGATAVGTGLNTSPEFARRALAVIHEQTGLSLRPAENYFEALGSRHALVATSGALKTLACDLMKIANDLRWLSSGPRCGLGEITLPALQPGSSMMPGKVNPVIPEAVCQVAARVMGNDLAVTVAGQSGWLELNVMMPLLADSLLEAIALLANSSRLLARRCVAGIEAQAERCQHWVEESLALATALAPRIGYDAAARLAQQAYQQGRTIRAVAQEATDLSAEELAHLLDAKRMTGHPATPCAISR